MNLTRIALLLVLLAVVASGCEEGTDSAPSANAPPPPPEKPVEKERVKAEAGVGKRGKLLEDETAYIAQPARALFRTEQRLAFMNVQRAVQLYEATHGRKIKSHEEFMEKVIRPNRLELPELPDGHRYIYDTEKGELMVERPVED